MIAHSATRAANGADDKGSGARELGLSYRPLALAIHEHYQQLLADGQVPAPAQRIAA